MQRILGSVLETVLHRYLTRYFENLDVSALRLSPFAGDVVLTNLVLRSEALRAAGLPLSFQRGFVRELRIRVPWLKLQSEAIEVLIDTVEVVASASASSDDEAGTAAVPSATDRNPQPSGAAPAALSSETPPSRAASGGGGGGGGDSWMQTLVSRALLNVVFRVRNAVVKCVEGRVVASLSLRSLEIHSADADWRRAFVELDGPSRARRTTPRFDPAPPVSVSYAVSSSSCARLPSRPVPSGLRPLAAPYPTPSHSVTRTPPLTLRPPPTPGLPFTQRPHERERPPSLPVSAGAYRKLIQLADLTLCVDGMEPSRGRVEHFERPLLRTPLLTMRALVHMQPSALPAAAATMAFDVLCHGIDASLSVSQLGLLGELGKVCCPSPWPSPRPSPWPSPRPSPRPSPDPTFSPGL